MPVPGPLDGLNRIDSILMYIRSNNINERTQIPTSAGGLILSFKDAFEFHITWVSDRSRLHDLGIQGNRLI